VVSFLVDVLLLGRTIARGIRGDPEFRAIAVLLLLLISGSTLFYSQVEHWSIVDSFYFCVMTIATVGFGDFAPHGDLSKMFTVGFAILGIGLFASFVGKLVALIIQSRKNAINAHHHDEHE